MFVRIKFLQDELKSGSNEELHSFCCKETSESSKP